jgi:uncharacterized protein
MIKEFFMECRVGCGACCIAPSISSAIPGMPQGKPAGIRCIQLNEDNKCKIFGQSNRPNVCLGLKASKEMCGASFEDAINFITTLEEQTKPSSSK